MSRRGTRTRVAVVAVGVLVSAALLTAPAGAAENDFSISANPTTVTVESGASGNSTISTAVASGSAQSVALSVSGLPAGSTGTLIPTSVTAGGSSTLTLNSGTAAAGTYEVTITGTEGTATHSANVTFTITVVKPADLSITNVGAPNPILSGKPLTYTITVTNSGDGTANEVTVKDQLPATVVFGSMSTTQGTCTRSPGTPKTKDGLVTCSVGSLGAGETATITIVVTPTKKGTLTDKATVSASNVTSDSDDEATAATTVPGS